MILVLTSVPDKPLAEAISQKLIRENLAACVHILSPHTAIYNWDGKINSEQEYDLLIKTIEDRYDEVESAILSMHPYDLPAVIKIPVSGGSDAFLQWVEKNSQG